LLAISTGAPYTTGKSPLAGRHLVATLFLLAASISAIAVQLRAHFAHQAAHEEFGGRDFGFHGQRHEVERGGGGGHNARGLTPSVHTSREEEEDGEEEERDAEEDGHDGSGEDDVENQGGEHEQGEEDGGGAGGELHAVLSAGGRAPSSRGGGEKARAQILSRQWVTQARNGAYNHMAMVSRLHNGTFLASWQVEPAPGRHCSPHHRMPFNSTNEGSKCDAGLPVI
jgi:hypothetical protein